MNRDEVKLVFDNSEDRDKVADQYGSYDNGVCSNSEIKPEQKRNHCPAIVL